MRFFLARHHRCAWPIAVFATASLPLSSCGQLKPVGTGDTMQLLRQGSEKVCIAPDVQKTLREIILPKPVEDEAEAASLDDRLKAASAIGFGYDLTTLQSFDPSVAKATCSTTLTLTSGTSSRQSKVQLAYAISPSAEAPSNFILTLSDDSGPKAVAAAMLTADVESIDDKKNQAQQARAAQEQKGRLLATISERWLTGAWIGSSDPAASCGNGQALWFEPGHVLSGTLGTGRWSLSGDRLHLVSRSPDKQVDETETITQADAISMTINPASGQEFSLRRCTRQETETLPQADAPAGAAA